MKLISWNITKKCNLSCRHCYRDAGEKAKGELTTREAKDLLCEIKKAGFNLVIFSGGEPLLRNDIYELINYANRLGLISSLGTNGLLLSSKAAKKLKNLKLSSAGISIDSVNSGYHNRLRKSKDSWQRAMEAAKNCRDANLTFQIHTTLTKENYLDIPKLVYLSAKLRAQAHYFFFLVPCGRAVDIDKDTLSPREHEHALKLIIEGRKKNRLYLRPICAPQFVRFSYKGGDIQNMEKGCLAGREYCLIGPEGDVYPCPYLPLEIGNVRMTKFSKIWKENLIFNSLRGNNLKGRCARCEFAFYCRGCRANSFYYKEDIMEEDPKCSYQPDSYLDAFDKKLIGYLQEDFPLVLKPFKELAARLGLSEDEVLFRASRLKSIGIIKRIGPIYNPEKLGFKRSLVAMSVPKEKIYEAVNFINSFSEVTHNYLRDDPEFNLWFTLICPSHKRISSIIKDIKDRTGIKEIISLPTVKTIKVRAVFKIDGLSPLISYDTQNNTKAGYPDSRIKSYNDLIHRPFGQIFHTVYEIFGLEIKSQPFTEKQLARIKRGLRSGRVRRFGAIANHQKLKFSHNALIAWKLKSMGEGIAEKLREKTYISHIYLRQANRLWLYSLYTMVHAHSQDELQSYLQEISQLLKYPAFKALTTIKEFKKTPFLPSHCQYL